MQNIDIEVLYAAHSGEQRLIALQVSPGTTALAAVQASGMLQAFTELSAAQLTLGIFSQLLKNPAHYILHAGDRIEIYRPLRLDPQTVRRKRALQNPVGKRRLRPHEYQQF